MALQEFESDNFRRELNEKLLARKIRFRESIAKWFTYIWGGNLVLGMLTSLFSGLLHIPPSAFDVWGVVFFVTFPIMVGSWVDAWLVAKTRAGDAPAYAPWVFVGAALGLFCIYNLSIFPWV